MPEITRFYGIVIKMFFKPNEHEPSHVYSVYGDYMGEFNIQTAEMIVGDFPKRAQNLVSEWILQNRTELQKMWDSQRIEKLPPLV